MRHSLLGNLLLFTFFTNDELAVAGSGTAVDDVFGLRTAAFALAHDHVLGIIRIEPHRHTPIKDIELAMEVFVGVFLHIRDDASIELVHIFKSLGDEVSTCLLTPYSTGTYRQHGLVFEVRKRFDELWKVTEVVHRWAD